MKLIACFFLSNIMSFLATYIPLGFNIFISILS